MMVKITLFQKDIIIMVETKQYSIHNNLAAKYFFFNIYFQTYPSTVGDHLCSLWLLHHFIEQKVRRDQLP